MENTTTEGPTLAELTGKYTKPGPYEHFSNGVKGALRHSQRHSVRSGFEHLNILSPHGFALTQARLADATVAHAEDTVPPPPESQTAQARIDAAYWTGYAAMSQAIDPDSGRAVLTSEEAAEVLGSYEQGIADVTHDSGCMTVLEHRAPAVWAAMTPLSQRAYRLGWDHLHAA
jgi:hypothetical protein